jgi:hypothetical protein
MAISCFSVLAVILASLGVLFSVIFSISLVGVNIYNGIISAINFVKVIPLYHSETPSTIIPSLYFGFTIIISLLTLYTAFKAGKSKGKTDEETNSQCSTPTSPRYTKDSEDDTYFNHRSAHHHLMNKNVICLVTLQLVWAATG